MNKKLSRRQFLKALTGAGASLAISGFLGKSLSRVIAQAMSEYIYLPLVQSGGTIPSTTRTPSATNTHNPESTPSAIPTTPMPPGSDPRVVHAHSTAATSWDRSDSDYWNYVDQDVVNTMVDQGITALTGASSTANAWRVLLPNYQPGQKIAIKVNFNNTFDCNTTGTMIDAVIHPINAIVRGLKQIGVDEGDIWVFDAIRAIPPHFVNGCLYNGVQYYDKGCHNQAGFSKDPSQYITFNPIAGIPMPRENRLTDVLRNATYLINVPIMKGHGLSGVSLSFKHHFGSIRDPFSLHEYITLGSNIYRSNYNPLVDIYNHSFIRGKTILTVGDGLFASKTIGNPPIYWTTFGNRLPNSLFFSTDPVALDCVLCDFLDAEFTLHSDTDGYLKLARDAGLGTFERGDPWGSGYNLIDYFKIDL